MIVLIIRFLFEKLSTNIYPVSILYYLLTIYYTIYPVTIYNVYLGLILGRELIKYLGRVLILTVVDSFLGIWVESVDSFQEVKKKNLYGGIF